MRLSASRCLQQLYYRQCLEATSLEGAADVAILKPFVVCRLCVMIECTSSSVVLAVVLAVVHC